MMVDNCQFDDVLLYKEDAPVGTADILQHAQPATTFEKTWKSSRLLAQPPRKGLGSRDRVGCQRNLRGSAPSPAVRMPGRRPGASLQIPAAIRRLR